MKWKLRQVWTVERHARIKCTLTWLSFLYNTLTDKTLVKTHLNQSVFFGFTDIERFEALIKEKASFPMMCQEMTILNKIKLKLIGFFAR